MKRAFFILFVLATVSCFSQTGQKITCYLSLQYNQTLYDQHPYYKDGIAGFGIQGFFFLKHKIRPTVELNADLFNEHSLGPADEPIEKRAFISSVYFGPSFHSSNKFYCATELGCSFYDKVHFGFRPSIGFYPGNRWLTKISFTNVFQEAENYDFGFLSFAAAFKF
ncbi:MAG: hypothetical protein ACJ75B_02855 [Flavisolibacter sp.]